MKRDSLPLHPLSNPGRPLRLSSLSARAAALVSLCLGGAGLTACSGDDIGDGDGQPTCTGAKCDDPGSGSDSVLGPALAECWIEDSGDPSGQIHELLCRYLSPNYPRRIAGVSIAGTGASGSDATVDLSTEQAGQPHSVGLFKADDYPITARVAIQFDDKDHSVPALEGLSGIADTVIIDGPDAATREEPQTASVPFDLWTITLLGRSRQPFSVGFDHLLPIGDDVYRVSFASRPVLYGRIESFLLPVRDAQEIAGIAAFEGVQEAKAIFSGPGAYVGREGRLMPAQETDMPSTMDGEPVARCWAEAHNERSQLIVCQRSATASALGAMSVEVTTPNTAHSVDLDPAEATFVAAVTDEAFPLTVSVGGEIVGKVSGLNPALRASPYQLSMELADPAELPSADSPAELCLPFALWTITLINDSDDFAGSLSEYVLELGEDWDGRFASLVGDAATPEIAAGEQATFVLAAPADVASLVGKGIATAEDGSLTEFPIELSRGQFRITADGLEPVAAP